jgi:hypothetical protein
MQARYFLTGYSCWMDLGFVVKAAEPCGATTITRARHIQLSWGEMNVKFVSKMERIKMALRQRLKPGGDRFKIQRTMFVLYVPNVPRATTGSTRAAPGLHPAHTDAPLSLLSLLLLLPLKALAASIPWEAAASYEELEKQRAF